MTAAQRALDAWNALDSKDGLGAALHVGQMLADALDAEIRSQGKSAKPDPVALGALSRTQERMGWGGVEVETYPPADDVREALEQHLREAVRMGVGWPKAEYLDRWIAEQLDVILAAFEVRPYGTVTDTEVADVPGFEGTRESLRSLGGRSDAAQPVWDDQPARWRDRWRKMRDRKAVLDVENARLRGALDDLNTDVEEFLSRAHQEGHEEAKSWMIRAQRRTIASLRARLRESEAHS